jgi:transcriptional regulator with XRE-family HTH domain
MAATPDAKQNLVGPHVRRLRMAANWSQEALAAKLQMAGWDVSRGGLSKIEAGLRRVNDAELWMLAKVLECQMADLFPTRSKVILGVLRQGRS